MKDAISLLAHTINSTDEAILVSTLHALRTFSHGDEEYIQAIIDHNIVPALLSKLEYEREEGEREKREREKK